MEAQERDEAGKRRVVVDAPLWWLKQVFLRVSYNYLKSEKLGEDIYQIPTALTFRQDNFSFPQKSQNPSFVTVIKLDISLSSKPSLFFIP